MREWFGDTPNEGSHPLPPRILPKTMSEYRAQQLDIAAQEAHELAVQSNVWSTLSRQLDHGFPHRDTEELMVLNETIETRNLIIGMTDRAREITKIPYKELYDVDAEGEVLSIQPVKGWTEEDGVMKRALSDLYWEDYFILYRSLHQQTPTPYADNIPLASTFDGATTLVRRAARKVLGAENRNHGWVGGTTWNSEMDEMSREGLPIDAIYDVFITKAKKEFPLFGSGFTKNKDPLIDVEHMVGKGIARINPIVIPSS